MIQNNRFQLCVGEAKKIGSKTIIWLPESMPRIVRIRTQTETKGTCPQQGFHERNSFQRSLPMKETLTATSASITAVEHFYTFKFSVAAMKSYENIRLSSLKFLCLICHRHGKGNICSHTPLSDSVVFLKIWSELDTKNRKDKYLLHGNWY